MSFTLCCLLLSVFLSPIFAQPDSVPQAESSFEPISNLHQWGIITSFHGLPSEIVTAIAQTKDGMMWFGTEHGLAKYDGRRVQTVSTQNLSNQKILTLKTDPNGTLWIGTENGAFRFINNNFQEITEIAGQSVNSILFSEIRKSIILACESGKIFEFQELPENTFTVKKILDEDLEIKTLAEFDDKFLIGTYSRGILVFENNQLNELKSRPRPFFINDLRTSDNKTLLIAAKIANEESGLYVAAKLTSPEKINELIGTVNSLDVDRSGNLWVGTKGRGAFQFYDKQKLNQFTFEGTSGGLRSNEILYVFVDRENVVWFGTDKGVCRFDRQSPRNVQFSADKESNFVRTIFQMENGLILVGTNRGLFVSEVNSRWRSIKGFENKAIYSISQDISGRILIGTSGGFFTVVNMPLETSVNNGIEDESFNESVRDIEIFQGKVYLSAFGTGVLKLENNELYSNFAVNSKDFQFNDVISLYSENDKKLWIGTAKNGVFFFDGKAFYRETALDSLQNTAIWEIDGSEEKGIWFATEKGLILFRNGEFNNFLPNTDVRDVKQLADENSVWCATLNGLVRLKFDLEFGWIVSNLDIEQGFSSQRIFTVFPQNNDKNSLLIGTNRGLIFYSFGETPPLIMPTRILSQRLHQPSELKNGITLEYPQNSLSIEVAALSSRTFPEQFRYAFVLRDGAGQIKKKTLSNDAQFLMENLSPDYYQVEIRAFDKNLLNSKPLIFNFTIEKAPFPWTSFFLSILLIFVIIALVWAILSQRKIFQTNKQLAIANDELSAARLDLANEAERERRRISRDLHDQTLADLRHLILMTDKLPAAQEKAEKITDFRIEIENVSTEIRRICEDLSPSVLENIGFTAALEWSLSNAVEQIPDEDKFKYEFICEDHLEENLRLSSSIQIQIYRIAQEVLSNISRHAEAKFVRMALKISPEGVFTMIIEDDGKNFDVENVQNAKGRGLLNIKARANLIESDVSWETKQTGGNRFKLQTVDNHKH